MNESGLMRRLRRVPRRIAAAISNEPSAPGPEQRLISAADRAIVERALPHSLTSEQRMLALIDAVRYCVRRQVPGAMVECGVWRGGSVLAMLLALQQVGVNDRDVYLFDTFEGMTQPGEEDTSAFEPPAIETWRDASRRGVRLWDYLFDPAQVSEEAVRTLLSSVGYPPSRIHFVRGAVEETLPDNAPREVSLLRLDTDWYASTRHELVHLFPRLSPAGVLIIDDYGHWEGSRRAVDEYFDSDADPLLLNRIDYNGRIAVKV